MLKGLHYFAAANGPPFRLISFSSIELKEESSILIKYFCFDYFGEICIRSCCLNGPNNKRKSAVHNAPMLFKSKFLHSSIEQFIEASVW
ncbi:hypothetical protein Plhal304r1_c021g0075661 [Plasmopara halstedii]